MEFFVGSAEENWFSLSAWVNFIMFIVRTPTFSIIWNGKLSNFFSPQRGIRQGDPLSPYLFVLCLEKLSHLIENAMNMGRW